MTERQMTDREIAEDCRGVSSGSPAGDPGFRAELAEQSRQYGLKGGLYSVAAEWAAGGRVG